jgi:hypothetical protein
LVNTQLGLHLEMKKKHSSAIEEEEDQVDVPLRDQRKKEDEKGKAKTQQEIWNINQGELNIASKEIIDVRGITDVGMMNAIIAVEEDTMLEIVDSRKSQQKATW